MRARSPAAEVTERPAAALAPALTPHGRLHLAAAEDAPALPEDVGERLRAAFDRGAGHGLLQLGAGEGRTALPAVFSYWRELGSLFVTAPFAFLATYTSRLSAHGQAQHFPLGQALREYAGSLAQGDGRRGRDLPPAALRSARSLPAPGRRPAARGSGRRAAHAGLLARPPAGSPAGHGHRGRQAPVRPRRGRPPRLPPGRVLALSGRRFAEAAAEAAAALALDPGDAHLRALAAYTLACDGRVTEARGLWLAAPVPLDAATSALFTRTFGE